jgi:hypothetical protein
MATVGQFALLKKYCLMGGQMGASKTKKSDAAQKWEAGLKERAQAVAAKLEADILIYAGDIAPFWDFHIGEQMRARKKGPNLLAVLTTYGGSADSAYRLARWVQDLYGEEGTTYFLVDTFCKSAGTLLAIGFEQIIMSPDAEFGPLDVQLRKADEIEERTSGLTTTQAMSTLRMEAYQSFEQFLVKLRRKTRISTKIANEVAAALTVGLFSPIYEQMDPIRLGENQRAMLIADEYGSRLVERSGSLKDKALNKLIQDYPSHEFVIDFAEAGSIFEHLRPTDDVEKLFVDYLRWTSVQHCCFGGDEGEFKSPFIKFWNSAELAAIVTAKSSNESEAKDESQNSDNLRTGNGEAESTNGAPESQGERVANDHQEG